MYIKKINIDNFTVFKTIKMNFSKGINIFIGENGTGKTHLMKMLYAPIASKNNKA
ncbi:MAG: AAA family ATPase, partial [Clostridium sp.]